jgi:excinuclease ABC subunit C
VQDEWPRVAYVRRVDKDGARYFGPYASPGSVYKALDTLNKLFAFRPTFNCSESWFKEHRRKGRPCTYHQMHRCLGPCVPGLVSQQEYRTAIEQVCNFLEGKTEAIMRGIRGQMEAAAEELNFERAAYLRDRITAIQKITERQQVLRSVDEDQDVLAFAREEGSAVVQVLFVRGGKLINAETFPLQGSEGESDTALLTSFITQFYDNAPNIPPQLLLAEHVDDPSIIAAWLQQKAGHRVALVVPQRGEKRQLVELAANNARTKLDELRQQWLNSEQRAVAGLAELRDLLELPDMPQRIECFDISNTQGQNSVASMVVFERGEPKPSAYRRFKIKTVQGANDVASINEVIARRFKRAAEALSSDEQLDPAAEIANEADAAERARDLPPDARQAVIEKWADLPDLLLIDGGRGQVNAALAALQALGFEQIPVVGVAKGPDRNRFDLVRPDRPELLVLDRTSRAINLVQRIDEEAHRFAITYHRKLRDKAFIASPLEAIPGIGPKRKKALLNAFGGMDGLRKASVQEIAAIPGMTQKAAEELKRML